MPTVQPVLFLMVLNLTPLKAVLVPVKPEGRAAPVEEVAVSMLFTVVTVVRTAQTVLKEHWPQVV